MSSGILINEIINRKKLISGLMDIISLPELSLELDYRSLNSISDGAEGWDDRLIDYSTEQLETAEEHWTEYSERN